MATPGPLGEQQGLSPRVQNCWPSTGQERGLTAREGPTATPKGRPFPPFLFMRDPGPPLNLYFLKSFLFFFIKKKNPIIAQISQQGSVWNKNSPS